MNSVKPSISIAMATYNGEKFLSQQIDSILNQTYQDFELIIWDDNSTDSTIEIVKTYMREHSNIQLYRNISNLGFVKNFEKAIESCESDYIALSDQDDIWEKNKLEIQMNEMKKAENSYPELPVMVHSDLVMIDENNNIIESSYFKFRNYKLKKAKDLGHILGPCGVMGNTVMLNKLLKKQLLPFPDKLDTHDYWIALINELLGKRVTIDKPLVKYVIHDNNTSNNKQEVDEKKISIPYINSNRKYIVDYIMEKYSLINEDINILKYFKQYLNQDDSIMFLMYYAFRYSLIKRDFFYRVRVMITLMMNHNYYFYNIMQILLRLNNFKGWGRKKTGNFALLCHYIFTGKRTLLEDGFIRSVGLGIDGSPSFSIVEDDIGIYYDATTPSKLENILNSYDFSSDTQLINRAHDAIELIKKYNISKYNNSKDVDDSFFNYKDEKRVLVIAQTAGDASLKYGMLDNYSTDEMINTALSENPNARVYLKVHPDVISGKKKSDIDIEFAKQKCIIIGENVNPISLLKHFSKVYTKTSQMGFEALLVGCECVCFGMPFYAGWGVTTDKSICQRRNRKLSVEEIFAAAYILYSRYYNPYKKKDSNIFDTIETIVKMRGAYS